MLGKKSVSIRRRMISGAVVALVIAATFAAPAAPSVAAGLQVSPKPLACPRVNLCWAVDENSGDLDRWDGHHFTRVSLARPAGFPATGDLFIESVACTVASSCWVVGSMDPEPATASGRRLVDNLAEHWNGRHWSSVPVPSTDGFDGLASVSCSNPNDCWATGSYESPSGGPDSSDNAVVVRAEAVHWNGHAWSMTHPPDAASFSQLYQLSCRQGQCWALEYSVTKASDDLWTLLHFAHGHWARVIAAAPVMGWWPAVSCSSASDCWLSGAHVVSRSPDVVITSKVAEHWNGRTWSPVNLPRVTGTKYSDFEEAVACPSAQSCWIVGDASTGGALALHWDGHAWSRIATGAPTDTTLYSISCVNAKDCWAGGVRDVSQDPVMLHWNGVRWSP